MEIGEEEMRISHKHLPSFLNLHRCFITPQARFLLRKWFAFTGLPKSLKKDEFRPKDFNFGSDSDETLEGGRMVVEAEIRSKDAAFSCSMRLKGEDFLVNFDTTALVSGIANGWMCREDLGHGYLSLESYLINERCVVSQGSEGLCVRVLFKELVSMYGGANEKHRAEHLLKTLMLVNDNPTERVSVMGLPTTSKLAMKNKIVFGTGDRWGAPTLTANMGGFVRAVAQSGMSLPTIHHSPPALTGD
ncbi:unnamed protein product [Eruca vesicaria subsp. sativa]|uniref:DUF1308 domain-containing protein n=1 Tax=Eruca vesicaria subsp. sativa TaxID=29727 RepID=A0ABC8LNT1_ERUVS|nr:unnamed protein product [Eruca vesicaria subsp. sativa]